MKKIALILIVIAMSGCGIFQKRCVDVDINKDKQKLMLLELDKLELDDIAFKVITEKNSKTIFTNLKKMKIDPALMGLTDTYYENNGLNFSKLYNRIYELNEQLRKYREYYEPDVTNMEDGTDEQ